MKELSDRGRCLHFESGNRCNHIIGAHSIQKSGQLKAILEDGHVTHIDPRIGSIVKNEGALSATTVSWNKVSTFNGFCQKHDNELFEPIDNSPLKPTKEQVILYAYRCLCREYFVKKNALSLTEKCIKDGSIPRKMLEPFNIGFKHGFTSLTFHKGKFDNSISTKRYDDIVFVCYESKSKWQTQFSGVLYPDFDFLGGKLQNIGNLNATLNLLTFFTAPTKDGWAFVFAWHKSSDVTCQRLLSSLSVIVENGALLEDAIFRFSLSCCENHAFRTSWWIKLSEMQKKVILKRAELMASPDIAVPSTYLSFGLEGIASWSFSKVA